MSSPRKFLDPRREAPIAPASAASPNSTKENNRNGRDLTPPKLPSSAFICFSDGKKASIMSKHGIMKDNDDLLRVVANEWGMLSDNERAYWEEVARLDKLRYVTEKAAYKGPWNIPKKRSKKNPLAPKRPMSAFLKFSQKRRQMVKRQNPNVGNTDVSRILGEMWRNASPTERNPYVEDEQRERAVYKENIKQFRDEQARLDAASRTPHKSVQPDQPQRSDPHAVARGYERIFEPNLEGLRLDSFDEPPLGSWGNHRNQHHHNQHNQHEHHRHAPQYQPPPVYHPHPHSYPHSAPRVNAPYAASAPANYMMDSSSRSQGSPTSHHSNSRSNNVGAHYTMNNDYQDTCNYPPLPPPRLSDDEPNAVNDRGVYYPEHAGYFRQYP